MSAPYYAGKVALRRAIGMARDAAIEVGGFQLPPDGTIFVFDRETAIAVALREVQERAKAQPVKLAAVA